MLVPLLLFSLSLGKRNVYLMPAYPMLALAVAPVLAEAGGRLLRATGLLIAFAAAAAAALLLALRANEPRLEPEVWIPILVLGLGSVPVATAAFRGMARTTLALVLGGILAVQTAVAAALPAIGRLKPVPRIAEVIRARQDPRDPEPALIHRLPIHSLNFYLGRATRVVGSGEQVAEEVARRGRAFVLTSQARLDEVLAAASHLAVEEVLRAPELVFRFERSVLGRGSTTRDLVLLDVRRR
jgi:4-amino-4-deoxy-L-arabinose transferase-like glycosyltransferase